MAQKLILCEGRANNDILIQPELSALVADGYEVKSASGFSTPDNRYMCLVLLSEPAAPEATEETPTVETPTENEPASETEPAAGGEGGEGGTE